MKMKIIHLLFFFLLFFTLTSEAFAAPDTTGAFVTEWDMSKISPATSITIRFLDDETGTYYWQEVGNPSHNSGATSTSFSSVSSLPITGLTGGTKYKVYLKGIKTFYSYVDGGNPSIPALTAVVSWGTIPWTSLSNAFVDAINLSTIPSQAPDLSHVTELTNMFANATSFNQSLDNWDVSHVTMMDGMFHDATSFNGSLNGWGSKVSLVTSMESMFSGATAFNQPLNDWKVSSVTTMEMMFDGATSFNQPLDGWNVSNVTNMESMFRHATSFNQSLGSWDLNSIGSPYGFGGDGYMLNYSGLDCKNYSLTLQGWAQNLNTPNGMILYNNLTYSSDVQPYRDILTGTKGWTITDKGIGACSVWPLPVHYAKELNAVYQGGGSTFLSWTTVQELNNKQFVVYRSTDSKNWNSVGVVNSYFADGNSNAGHAYSFTDNTTPEGTVYYYLKQVDKDGGTSSSGIVSIVSNGSSLMGVVLYPNPAASDVWVTGASQGSVIRIIGTDGKVYQSSVVNASPQPVKVSRLTSGVYFVQVFKGNALIQTIKLVKK